eukprot:TRINITY_DN4334_c0_g1_i2.p1 TRINITY_DN4334_c0_g1~~TRINITY_DN4334_c0_g1_i2.p1  ORF type:complete len:279 (+),score=77.76 TRINITY_DN4334_c0_g1_i2:86-922(+)
MMYPLHMTEVEFHKAFTFWWIVLAIIVFVALQFYTAPYGRHAGKNSLKMNNRLCWFLMEIPSPTLVVGLAIWAAPNHYDWARIFFAFLWFAHYFHRCFIFPLRIESKSTTMNVPILLQAFFFNIANGYVNGRYLWTVSPSEAYSSSYLLNWNVWLGTLLFVLGAYINIKSDIMFAELRKKSDAKKNEDLKKEEFVNNSGSSYSVPRGFLFEYLANPNYFGELIEWAAFYLITQNYATLSFLIWVIANLVPRAKSNLDWNRKHIPNYPKDRKAIIPFLY